MELPVAVFNLGAQAEKVMDYNNGIILDSKDPEIIVKSIFALLVKLGFTPI